MPIELINKLHESNSNTPNTGELARLEHTC